jgi:hypothetical protein
MTRRRKAAVGDVVMVTSPMHFVIVAIDPDKVNGYQAIEADGQGRSPRGAVRWFDATQFEPTGRRSRTPGRHYRQHLRYVELTGVTPECSCLCCPAHFSEADTLPELVADAKTAKRDGIDARKVKRERSRELRELTGRA